MSNKTLAHTIEQSIASERSTFERDLAYAVEAMTRINNATHSRAISSELIQLAQRVTALTVQAGQLEADTSTLMLIKETADTNDGGQDR